MVKNQKSPILWFISLFIRLFLLLLLSLQCVALVCEFVYGYIPLPPKQINEYFASHPLEDLRIEAKNYQLRLDGKVEAQDLALFKEGNQKPLIKAESALLHWGMRGSERGLRLVGCIISGGTLYQPAIYSPDGMHRPLLNNIAIDLEFEDDSVRANAICAKLDNWILRGTVDIAVNRFQTNTLEDTDLLDSFYKLASRIQKQQADHNYLTSPTLTFNLQRTTAEAAHLELHISSPEIKSEQIGSDRVSIDLSLRLQGDQVLLAEPALITGQNVRMPAYGVTAEEASCSIRPDEIHRLLQKQLPRIKFCAQRLMLAEYTLEYPTFEVTESSPERLEVCGSTSLYGCVSRIKATYFPEEQRSEIAASGELHPNRIIELLPASILKNLPLLDFLDALDYSAKVRLNKNEKLEYIGFTLQTNRVKAGDVHFDHIQAKGEHYKGIIKVPNLEVYRNDEYAKASIKIDTQEHTAHILANGRIQPKEYGSLLPTWWGHIFKDFTFHSKALTQANFAINSAYLRQAGTRFYGVVKLNDATYSKVPLEKATVQVNGNPLHIQLDISQVQSTEGSFAGTIDLTRRQDGIPSLLALHLDVETELSIDATRHLVGELLYKRTVGDFTFTGRPKIQLDGSSYFSGRYPEFKGKSNFSFYADSAGSLEYNHAPLEYLTLNGYSDDRVTQLRNISFGYAQGLGNGSVDITSRPGRAGFACVEVNLIEADGQSAIQNLPALDQIEDDFQTPEEARSGSSAGGDSGLLDAQLHACGPLDDPYRFTGEGRFSIRDRDLGTIQLLGPLSILLQGTVLGFTSFELNKMSAEFLVQDGIAEFTELLVNGPITRIEANGSMALESHALDMRVAVQLFGNSTDRNNPITRITDIISPLSTFLRFDLSGTLEKQRWRSIFDPRKLLPGI